MQATLAYLEAINEISMAERAVDGQGAKADAWLRLIQAYDAAEAAWEDLTPHLQVPGCLLRLSDRRASFELTQTLEQLRARANQR